MDLKWHIYWFHFFLVFIIIIGYCTLVPVGQLDEADYCRNYNLHFHSTATLYIKVGKISLISLNIKEVAVTLLSILWSDIYHLYRYSWRDYIQNLYNT